MDVSDQSTPRAVGHRRRPDVRLRTIAAACRITERTAQAIVADLEQAGYLSRERIGRRNRYMLHADGTFRHPSEPGLPIRHLLEIFTGREAHAARSLP
ncbi:helix-turn-helix transcriptional regulator [Streptomyces sp. NPDC057623]|uniref:helix-turn-helix transcriptional regulator n=1 Tax=Streptomyces sp. NPDC057623 TaxID=3346187 RepID=UPI0036BC52B2